MVNNLLKQCKKRESSARSRPSNSASNSHSNSNSSSKEKENENPKKRRRVLKLMDARLYRGLWLGTRPKKPKLSEVEVIESPSKKQKEAIKEASILSVRQPSLHFDLEISKDDEINACLFCTAPPTGPLLFCEGKDCNKRCHVACFDSKLKKPPAGAWFCVPCVQKRIKFGFHAVSRGPESLWSVKEGKYFVKYKSLAHVHNKWISEAEICQEAHQIISEYDSLIKKEKAPIWRKEWTEPQRIVRTRFLMPPKTAEGFFANNKSLRFCNKELLVKWRGLGYEQATWEFLSFLKNDVLLSEYEGRKKMAKEASYHSFVVKAMKVKENPLVKLERLPAGTNNDFLISINKIREFWHASKHALFIDKQDRIMKTVLFIQSVIKDLWRPILIISTEDLISHWESELQNSTPRINMVLYTGTKKERELIRDLEFYEEESKCVMVQVLISHPEAILEDFETIDIGWGALIIDEFKSSQITKKIDKLIKLGADFKLLLSSSLLNDEILEYSNVLSYLDPLYQYVKQTNQALEMLKEKLKNHVINEQKCDIQEDSMDMIESMSKRRKAAIPTKHKKDALKIERYKDRETAKHKQSSKLIEFELHVKKQYERLEEFYDRLGKSEEKLKDEWIEKAKLGKLEKSFDNAPSGFFIIDPFDWACKDEEFVEIDKEMGNEETSSRKTVIGKNVNGEEMMNERDELTSQQNRDDSICSSNEKDAEGTEPVTGRETASEQVVNGHSMDIDTENGDHTTPTDLVEESFSVRESVMNDVGNINMKNGNEELVNHTTQMVEQTVNRWEVGNEQVVIERSLDTDEGMVQFSPIVEPIIIDLVERTCDDQETVSYDVVSENVRNGNEKTVNCEALIGDMINNEERVNNEEIKEAVVDEEMVTDEEICGGVNNEGIVREETLNEGGLTEVEEEEERLNDGEKTCDDQKIVDDYVVNENVRNAKEKSVSDRTENVQCESDGPVKMINEEMEIDKGKGDDVFPDQEAAAKSDQIESAKDELNREITNNREIINEKEVENEDLMNNEEMAIDAEKKDDHVIPDVPINEETSVTSDHSEPTKNKLIKETTLNQELINENHVENEVDSYSHNSEPTDLPTDHETRAISDDSETSKNELLEETSNNQEMINERELENEDMMNIDQDQTSPTDFNFVIETLDGPQIINVNMEHENGEELVPTETNSPVALNNEFNSHGEMIEAIDEALNNKDMVINPVDEETAILETVAGNTVNGVTIIEEDEDVLPVYQVPESTIPQNPIPSSNQNTPSGAPTSARNPQSSSAVYTNPITIQPSLPPQINSPAVTTSSPILTPPRTATPSPTNALAGATSSPPTNAPTGATSAPFNAPGGAATSSRTNAPSGATSAPSNMPAGSAISAGVRYPVMTSNAFAGMVLSPDPLKNELMKIKYQAEAVDTAYQYKKMQGKTEYEVEVKRVIRKYQDLEREAELEFENEKKRISEIYQKLRENVILAEQFRTWYMGQQQPTSISSFLQVQASRSQAPLPVPLHVQPYQQQMNTSHNINLRQFSPHQSFSVPSSSFPPVLDQMGLFANIPSTSQAPVQNHFTNPPVQPSAGDRQSRSFLPCNSLSNQTQPAPHLIFRPAGGAMSSNAELATGDMRFYSRQLRSLMGVIRAQEFDASSSGGGSNWRNLSVRFGNGGGNVGNNGDVAGNDRFGG